MTATTVRRPTIELLSAVDGTHVAVVAPTIAGVVAGMGLVDAGAAPAPAGMWIPQVADGDEVDAGTPLLELHGTATELGVAEDHAMGVLGFAGGIARRASELVKAAPPGLRVVCGGWKKLPASLKPVLRAGLDVAGVGHRLVDGPFVYVPKTHVRLLGGVGAAVRAAAALDRGRPAVQVTSVAEARQALEAGARILMVDTGNLGDLAAVDEAMRTDGLRDEALLAFGGGVTDAQLDAAAGAGADAVDVGRAVLDAPLWDLHVEVVT
ncbi:MAG TPA: hypothetical protein VGA36_08080 [Nitriliruptorales bacterium]